MRTLPARSRLADTWVRIRRARIRTDMRIAMVAPPWFPVPPQDYGPLLLRDQPLPVVHTVHGGLEDKHALAVYEAVCDRVELVAISRAYRDQAPQLRWAAVIPNPVEVSDYELVEQKDEYVVFMARFSHVKGA